jgi:hypothetical protein
MLDWKRAIEDERAALMRIVALLGALAGLAELAAGRSPAMRGFVLWVLRRAEAVARDFVAGGPDAEIAPMPVEPVGARPVDAMRLAASFRRLALQLRSQARLMRGERGDGSAGTQPPQPGVMPATRGVATGISVLAASASTIPHPAPDTS